MGDGRKERKRVEYKRQVYVTEPKKEEEWAGADERAAISAVPYVGRR